MNSWGHRVMTVGLLCGLMGGPTAAAPADELPFGPAYSDLKIARQLVGLQLTKPQAEAIAPILQALRSRLAQRAAVDQQFQRDTAQVTSGLVETELAGNPASPEAVAAVAEQAALYDEQRQPYDAVIYQAANNIWLTLTDAQRARIESNEAAAMRKQAENQVGLRRSAAVAAAREQLSWVRNSPDGEYRQLKPSRVMAIAQAMWPAADPAFVQGIAGRLATFFDMVRRMDRTQYSQTQAQLDRQLSGILSPQAPPAATAGLLSNDDWVDLVQNPRTVDLLLALARVLPEEAKP